MIGDSAPKRKCYLMFFSIRIQPIISVGIKYVTYVQWVRHFGCGPESLVIRIRYHRSLPFPTTNLIANRIWDGWGVPFTVL